MTTIPTVERIEESHCSICLQNCTRLCVRCGASYCNKHLLVHSDQCHHKYYKVIGAILRDVMTDSIKQLLAFAVPTI